jgi:tetratricopeptide (TPR) repeat protein
MKAPGSPRAAWPLLLVMASSVTALVPGLAAWTPPSSPAPSHFERWWPEVVTRLDRAVVTGKAAEYREVRTLCLRGLEASLEPEQAASARYALAYANWRLIRLPGSDEEEQLALLDEAAAHLQAALDKDPRHAEAHALLASVYGSQISLADWKGMTLLSKLRDSFARARALEPGNPRLLLLEGVGLYHTPADYGGGIDKAEALLRAAIEGFEAEPAPFSWPRWGRLDAYAWLGQMRARRGDRAGARAAYEKALGIAPEFRWVRTVLLPRLEPPP